MENRWNSTIDEKLEVNYLYNGQVRASCRAWTVICSSSSLSSTSRSTVFFSEKLGPLSDPATTRSDKHARGKPTLTDPDKQAAGNRETNMRKIFQTRCTRRNPTQDILDWLQPVKLISRTWRCVLADSSERSEHRFGRWRFKKWRDKNGSTVFMLTFRKYREPSLKPKVYSYGRLWRIIMEAISYRLETWNCWTSCASSKKKWHQRIVAIWIEWRMMVIFHEMLFTICRMSKTS